MAINFRKGYSTAGRTALVGALALGYGCGGQEPAITVSDRWVTETYMTNHDDQNSNIVNAPRQTSLVVQDCDSQKQCINYIFPSTDGRGEDAVRASHRMKKGDKIRYRPGDIDSLRYDQ